MSSQTFCGIRSLTPLSQATTPSTSSTAQHSPRLSRTGRPQKSLFAASLHSLVGESLSRAYRELSAQPLRLLRFCQSLQDLHPTSPSAASEHYSALAAQVLANPPYQSSQPSTSATPIPTDSEISLVRCQCYLLLGLYECTEGVENRGWMKIGTAIRMAQLLRLGFEDDDEGSISRSRADPLQSEIRRRTFWSCFLLDRTITDGRERPCTLKAPLPSVLRMPGADADFQLGRKGQLGARFDPNPPRWNLSSKMEAAAPLEHEADLYGQTLRVAEIWQRVATYIASGGRNFDRRAPWIPESTFATLQQDLGTFSSLLPEFYQFSEANLVAHCMIGQGRLFGMMHLLFACATLNLHRDYLPFLPTMDFKVSCPSSMAPQS